MAVGRCQIENLVVRIDFENTAAVGSPLTKHAVVACGEKGSVRVPPNPSTSEWMRIRPIPFRAGRRQPVDEHSAGRVANRKKPSVMGSVKILQRRREAFDAIDRIPLIESPEKYAAIGRT